MYSSSMAKKAVSPSDAALQRVREVCFSFPGAEEKLSHGAPSFHVRGKMYVTFVDDHHGDGRLAIWCKATPEEQRRLVETDPARFFVPPYVGVKGWVGIVLNHPKTDWIELAIIVEAGWAAIAPKNASKLEVRPPPKMPARPTTDADVARAALEKLTKICAALPETERERESSQATFRVRKKVFVYFLDNHHGDGNVAVCVRTAKEGGHLALVKKEPKRFFLPAYIGARGWVGVRVDAPRVDWKDVAARVTESYRAVAPKGLAAQV